MQTTSVIVFSLLPWKYPEDRSVLVHQGTIHLTKRRVCSNGHYHLFADFKLRSCSHDNGTERLASGQFTEKPTRYSSLSRLESLWCTHSNLSTNALLWMSSSVRRLDRADDKRKDRLRSSVTDTLTGQLLCFLGDILSLYVLFTGMYIYRRGWI